jgi:hypothetical protein
MEQVEKIKKLIELNDKRLAIQKEKMEVVREQKYEKAAALRDKEKQVISAISEIVEINVEDYVSRDVYRKVEDGFYEVLNFIEEGDTNLTPALLRKLSHDVNTERAKGEELKERLKEEVKKFEWTSTRQERPALVKDGKEGDREWKESEEVLILYVKNDGDHGVCIARYTEEWIDLNNRSCTFQVSEEVRDAYETSHTMSKNSFKEREPESKAPKGWAEIPGMKVKGWMAIPEKKIPNRR